MSAGEWESVRKSFPKQGLTDEDEQAATLRNHGWIMTPPPECRWYVALHPELGAVTLAEAYKFATDEEE